MKRAVFAAEIGGKEDLTQAHGKIVGSAFAVGEGLCSLPIGFV